MESRDRDTDHVIYRTQGDGFVNQENVWERADGACTSSHFLHRFRNTPKDRYQQEFPEFINKTVVSASDDELLARQLKYRIRIVYIR